MYSKSQTVSPKPQNIFVTALPSSISAPSLLLLQKPTSSTTGGGAGSHRKQQTRQTSTGSGSNKNKPINNSVEQLKGDRKNSGGKNKNRKFSNNTNKNNNINNNSNNNSNITSSNIAIKCDSTNNNIENEICKTTNLFLNRLHLESSSSSSSNSTPSSSSPTLLNNSNTIDIKDQINLERTASSKVEQQDGEEETFIESSFEEVTNSSTITLTFEEQFEILPISIDEETLKQYTSFLNILSEIITDMCDCEGDATNLEILRPPAAQLSTSPKIATSSLSTVEKFQVFNVDQIPEISIQAYIERVFKYLPFGTDIFIFSTIYLDRLIQSNQEIQISPLNIHRLFMASIIVASKFHNDKALNNRYYAQVGGISLSEMNQLEIHFLLLLNWKLNIDPEIFNAFKTSIQSKVDILDIKIKSNSNLDNNNMTIASTTTPPPTTTTTTTIIPTPPTVTNNNNNISNNICNSNNSNNNQPPQPPKRYVTLIEKESENKNNNVVKQPPTTNKFSGNKKGTAPTSQFSKIINNRHSNKNGYHHPNYLTYPLAAPAQTTSNQFSNYNSNNSHHSHNHHQQQHQTHQQISQQHYQPYYNQQQQQYYSNYQQQQQQYNQAYYGGGGGSGQSYEEFYPQNSYSGGMYQYTSSSTSPNIDYIGDSYDSIDPSSSYGSDNFSVNSNSTTIGGGSSMGSSNGSAPHLQSSYLPHSWQNAYYYNGNNGGASSVGNSSSQQQQFPYHHTPNYQ